MGLSRWEKEVEAEDLAVFGPELGPVYSALSSDVLWLHTKWLEYRELFAGTVARVKLLNDTSPGFFSILQHVLWRDVLLHIARLTDPPTQAGRENLTLLSLPPLLECPFHREVEAMLKATTEKSAFARRFRNKHLAHQDKDHALDRVKPLTAGSRKDVEEALESFASVLNAVNSHYREATMLYREPSSLSDANLLLYWLNFAQLTEAQRQARIRAGNPTPEDLEYYDAP